MKQYFMLFICLFVAACSTGIPIEKYHSLPAAPEEFSICHGYSCTHKSKAGFSKGEWQKINAVLKSSPANSAKSERSKIGKVIGLMEIYTGKKTGTDKDIEAAVSSKSDNYQLDCIDETINTTQYLKMLQKAGLLKFHETALPTHRGYIVDGTWPHNTAVIREVKSGALFVVDSFYRANGGEPYIVPRADWLAGWKPPGATQ